MARIAEQEREHAALMIQRVFRGDQARVLVTALRIEGAVVRLQSSFRGWRARCWAASARAAAPRVSPRRTFEFEASASDEEVEEECGGDAESDLPDQPESNADSDLPDQPESVVVPQDPAESDALRTLAFAQAEATAALSEARRRAPLAPAALGPAALAPAPLAPAALAPAPLAPAALAPAAPEPRRPPQHLAAPGAQETPRLGSPTASEGSEDPLRRLECDISPPPLSPTTVERTVHEFLIRTDCIPAPASGPVEVWPREDTVEMRAQLAQMTRACGWASEQQPQHEVSEPGSPLMSASAPTLP